jgi:hemoglobin
LPRPPQSSEIPSVSFGFELSLFHCSYIRLPYLTPYCSLFRIDLPPPEALRATVDIFYERLVADEQLKIFFDEVSVTRLRAHQFNFLSIAFTEIPADMDVYQYMIDKHSRLFNEKGLNGTHFDLVAGHLVASLQQLNVPENLVTEVVSIVGPLRAAFADEAERVANEKK